MSKFFFRLSPKVQLELFKSVFIYYILKLILKLIILRLILDKLIIINNNNGFKVRFGVEGRHRGPPSPRSQQYALVKPRREEGEKVMGRRVSFQIAMISRLTRFTLLANLVESRRATNYNSDRLEVCFE